MNIIIHEYEGKKIAEIVSEDIIVKLPADVLDLIANPKIPFSKKIILQRKNISPDFFKLSAGFAGEMLQKLANYMVQLAIVGDFSDIKSPVFQAFISESNRGRQNFFAKDINEAINFLAG